MNHMPMFWSVFALVLAIISVIIAIMQNSFLTPMYLILLAIFIVVYTGAKVPWS